MAENVEEANKDNDWLAALHSGKIKEQKKESPPKTKPTRIISSKQLRAIRG